MFHKFLNSLKTAHNQSLIEAIQEGYSCCFESHDALTYVNENKLSKEYSLLHYMYVPVYNKLQEEANDAAIHLGNFEFSLWTNNIKYLKSIHDQGSDVWKKHAFELNREYFKF